MALKFGIPLTALALAATPLSHADDHDPHHPTFELHGGLGRTVFDTPLEDTGHYQLGLGMNLGERWGLELMASQFDTEQSETGADIDGEQYRLDALYHLADRNQRARPYFAFGVGDQELSGPTLARAQNDTLINAGVGVKYQLSKRWLWRTDMRLFNNLDAEHTDFAISTGLSFLFGYDDRPARSTAPEPATTTPQDSDNDGVVDNRDQCPDTPEGVRVDARGCALDSDRDGVPDHRDNCPNTARQYRVDDQGCPVELTESVSIEMQVQFETNSAEVREQFMPEVQQVADFMRQFDQTRVTVEGHTDSSGAAAYNQQLSQRRAEAVREVLIERFGLPANRVEAVGYGEERPIADNDTASGREQNRRVVAEISADVTRTETRD